MKKRNLTPKEKSERIKRERDPIPWRYCLLTLICGLLLVGGFFWGARQHFSAMDLGIKNAKLREQKENLKDEAQRLYLAKENLLSPDQIRKAAKKLGFQEYTTQSVQVITPNTKDEKPLNEDSKQIAVPKEKDEKNEKVKKIEPSKNEEKTKVGKTKPPTSRATETRTRIAKNN